MTPAKTPADASQRRRIFGGVFLEEGMGHGAGRQMGPIAEVGMSSATKVSRQQKKPSKYPRCFAGAGGECGKMWDTHNYFYSGYKEKEVNLILKFLEIGLWNGLIFSVYNIYIFLCVPNRFCFW